MTRALGFVLCVLLLLANVQLTFADPEQCREAINQLRSAKIEVADALRTYGSCLSGNDGTDDCSSEFSALHSAQDDFESAVSSYQSDCP